MTRSTVSTGEIMRGLREEPVEIRVLAKRWGLSYDGVRRRMLTRVGIGPSAYRALLGWHSRTVSPELAQEILQRYGTSGMSVPDLAAEMGLPSSTVRGVCANSGLWSRRAFNDIEDGEIAAMYTDGLSCQQIADRAGTDEKAVRSALTRAGVPRRPMGRPPRGGR